MSNLTQMIIFKRDGRQVNFDRDKIVTAISKAMEEVGGVDGIDYETALLVASDIEDMIRDEDIEPNIESIQDEVEFSLMELGLTKVAKAYILYRKERDIIRNLPLRESYEFLSNDFLKKFSKQPDPFPSELGKFVYNRTYARPIPSENRRERWWETIARVVEFSAQLEKEAILNSKGKITQKEINKLIEEAETMYKMMFRLEMFPSGRTLWVGNTPASKEYSLSNFNCFSRETRFVTDKGIKSFEDFNSGDTVKVLDSNGGWADATVRNFGESELVELVFTKGRATKKIRTTRDHRWFIHGKRGGKYLEKTTEELSIGDRLREKRRYEKQDVVPCQIGVQHGIVYGDGTYDKKKGFCSVSLVGEKQELTKHFHTGTFCDIGQGEQTRIYGLPYNWKELPSIEANIEYLYGFLIGYFSADGNVSSNQYTMSSSNKKDLEFVKDVCSLVGMSTGDVLLQREVSPFDGSYAPLYSINISNMGIQQDFLLREKHKQNTRKTKKRNFYWTLKEVNNVEEREDVWCVQEPKTESFTLEGDILTRNCSFVAIDDMKKFSEMFFVLMLGTL